MRITKGYVFFDRCIHPVSEVLKAAELAAMEGSGSTVADRATETGPVPPAVPPRTSSVATDGDLGTETHREPDSDLGSCSACGSVRVYCSFLKSMPCCDECGKSYGKTHVKGYTS